MNQWKNFSKGFIKENPVFVLLLGMCPTLGVTSSAINGLGMGLATTFVLLMSNIVVSLIKSQIPDKVRIPSFIVIIAAFVTVVQLVMQAYLPELYKSLGLFIPLIVLNDKRNLVDIVALLRHILAEIVHAFQVRLQALQLRISNEDHSVYALEDQLATRVIEHLPRYGVQVEPCLEASDFTERKRQEIEKERPLCFRCEADHLALSVRICALVNVLQVGGFTAEARAVVDDLAVDLPSHVIDEAHLSRIPLVVEQTIDVVIGDFAKRRIARRLCLVQELFEDLIQLFRRLSHTQPYQAKARLRVEYHHQDHPVPHKLNVDVLVFPFVELGSKLVLPK